MKVKKNSKPLKKKNGNGVLTRSMKANAENRSNEIKTRSRTNKNDEITVLPSIAAPIATTNTKKHEKKRNEAHQNSNVLEKNGRGTNGKIANDAPISNSLGARKPNKSVKRGKKSRRNSSKTVAVYSDDYDVYLVNDLTWTKLKGFAVWPSKVSFKI